MQNLEPPELHSLSAAMGWMELGNLAEAKAELAEIGPAYQNHPDVLEARWSICAAEEKWFDALQIARMLLHHAPERSSGWLHQAYALRRVPDGSVKASGTAWCRVSANFRRNRTFVYNFSRN